MYHKPTGLTEFVLQEERKHKDARGQFTHLLTHIAFAGKIIASHIKKAGLVDILGKTGDLNPTEDEVIKLDRFSNDLLVDILSASGQTAAIASEEMADFHIPHTTHGDYVVYFDPLDGSSNTAVNVTVGTIFSIYRKRGGAILQPGDQQVASGYILYGTSVMFVYTCGDGVNGFTLDPSIGSFLLSHKDIRIPKKGSIYSVNEAHFPEWKDTDQKYLTLLKSEGYKSRYIGSMVADVHRTLLQGGVFFHPADKEYPNGKLRLMIEINPLSYLIEQAGGKSLSGDNSPLSIIPECLHEQKPVVLGGKYEMELYEKLR